MSQKRLSESALPELPAQVSTPSYKRADVRPGIVHLGIGAFHRAHQAWYTEQCIAAGETDWGIIAASLRSPGVRDQLAPQDNLYSLVEKSNQGNRLQVIGCIGDVVVAPEAPNHLLELLAREEIRIVSLTITEKGYCHDPASGHLNPQHPDVLHDLDDLQKPRSALGFIVGALQLRKDRGLPGFTLLSCDNLPGNGHLLQRVIEQFAERVDTQLADWIRDNTRCPATMVDRIVPATTDADRDQLAETLEFRDEAAVIAEPFSQWIVEDRFLRGRPSWEMAGATFVDNVEPYELIKLRLLNGCHSLLAYSGYLAGYETIADVMEDPAFAQMAQRFMESEAANSVQAPDGFDLGAYRNQLLERFRNRALRHRTWQIAMDGSQKIPQRWLGTLRHQLDCGGTIELLSLALACWIRYVSARDDSGEMIEVSDPLAAELRTLWARNIASGHKAVASAFLQFSPVFGDDLQHSRRLHQAVSHWLAILAKHGTRGAIQQFFLNSTEAEAAIPAS